jgi:hypothetical protein
MYAVKKECTMSAERWGVKRHALVPLAVIALVGFGAWAPREPLRDAVTLAAINGVALRLPSSFIVLAPVLGPMDVLTVLPLSQQLAFVVTVVVLFAAWRLLRRRERHGPWRRAAIEIGAATVFVAVGLSYCAAVVLLKRPSAALRVEDAEVVVVDFHSHTDRSHDGRTGFGAEQNRAWHAATGFDVAYVTDHFTWQEHANPETAAEGTVLLSGAEVRLAGRHVNALGDSTRYVHLLDNTRRKLRREHLGTIASAASPTLVVALPIPFEMIDRVVQAGHGTVVALELHDGDPRGIEQLRRQHDSLLALAARLGLACVSGTNLHGWGRTASAWTLVRLPGWRALTPDQLNAALERGVRANQRGTIRVVERAVDYPGSSVATLALTLPLAVAYLFRTLQPLERVAWIAWLVGGWVVLTYAGRIRGRAAARDAAQREDPEPGADGRNTTGGAGGPYPGLARDL